jgi:predicted GNAT family acetyltransferase
VLTASFARVLGPGHAAQVSRVLTTDPVASCMVAARFEQVGMNEAAMGGQFWGVAGGRDGLLFAGASMVPLAGDAAAMRSFAHVAARRGRKCATILGSADLVLPLWDRLESRWGPARDVRDDQPLMACPGQPIGPLDPHVRAVRPEELDAYYPSAVSMFTEEVGVDPRTGDNGRGYRARIAELIGSGRAYARFDGKSVMFKAEIGSRGCGCIRTCAGGDWPDPRWRPSCGRSTATWAARRACTSTSTTGRRAAPTTGSVFSRSARSPPCCSDGGVLCCGVPCAVP